MPCNLDYDLVEFHMELNNLGITALCGSVTTIIDCSSFLVRPPGRPNAPNLGVDFFTFNFSF